MKQTILFMLILGLIAGCATASGHGFASTARNWYRASSTTEQTEADLVDCKESSGYSKALFLTERAAYSYDSYVEGCMSKKGYEWTQAGRRPLLKAVPDFQNKHLAVLP